MRAFRVEGDPDRAGSPGDDPVIVNGVGLGEQQVQRGNRWHIRDRNQVPAAEPADLAFDAALVPRRQVRPIRRVPSEPCG